MQLNINASSYYSNPAEEFPHPNTSTPLLREGLTLCQEVRGSQSSSATALSLCLSKRQPRDAGVGGVVERGP